MEMEISTSRSLKMCEIHLRGEARACGGSSGARLRGVRAWLGVIVERACEGRRWREERNE
eukprot:5947346-Prymnesium_polylepis.1